MYLSSAVVLLTLGLTTALPQATQVPGYTKLSKEQVRHLQNKGFGPTVPTIFKTSASSYDEEQEDAEDTNVASTQVRGSIYGNENYPIQNAIPVQQRPQQPRPSPQQGGQRRLPQQFKPQYIDGDEDELLKKKNPEEDEKEEPDRLTLLLPQSKFDCTGKNTGYYADDGLSCEVFHYCQDNARHSWICPEGFTFHQVHLICMPPSVENICEKSSQFHFVNEYLYKPLNLEEHQAKPNVSLRYSDRYYPEEFYEGRYEEEDEDVAQNRRQPIRVGLQHVDQNQNQNQARRQPPVPQYSPTFRPETTVSQVFRSPEEVNISLQQRRPQFANQRYVTQNVEY